MKGEGGGGRENQVDWGEYEVPSSPDSYDCNGDHKQCEKVVGGAE